MRLLVISHYFWPEDFRINELVAELAGRGHDVTVLTGKPNYPSGRIHPEFLENPERFASYGGARVVRVPIVSRGGRFRLVLNYFSYALSAATIGALRLRGERFDAIFVFQPSPATVGIPAMVFRRLKRCPIVWWVLDQWPETLSAVGAVTSKPVLRAIGSAVSVFYGNCEAVLTTSRGLIPEIRKYCPSATRVAYFPNWVESTYALEGVSPATEVPADIARFSVMFAGNIGESQDFPAILDAASQLAGRAPVRWLIVGDGRRADWVRTEIARRGLQGHVLLFGRHPIDRMPAFYAHAGALLVSLKAQPIFAMTVPGKVQSYLASGIPILGMLDGEGARVIEEAEAGLTCPAGDAHRLADIVLQMAALTESERKAMGGRGRAYAKREFDREVLVNGLEQQLVRARSQFTRPPRPTSAVRTGR